MIKKIIRIITAGLLWLSAVAHANSGLLFHVESSGPPISVRAVLCLDGKGALSCQIYHFPAADVRITTTIKHHYPAEGIKILTPGYKPAGCTISPNGYCLFSASTTSAANLSIETIETYSVGGSINNLTGTGLVLQNNGSDDLTVQSGASSFTFSQTLSAGRAYQVTIAQQPTHQTCTVNQGSGIVQSTVTSVQINCVANPTTLSVTGSPLLLMPNTTGSLSVTNNGSDPAHNVVADVPPGLAINVTQDASNCVSLAAGQTCYLRFTSNEQPYPVTTVNIAGSNTNTETASLTLAYPYITPGGTVNALAYDAVNHLIYLGGTFTSIGPNIAYGVPIDGSTGQPVPLFPRVNGGVNVAISDNQGGWYIGGGFTFVNSVALTRLAHILSDGSVDSAWTPPAVNSSVRTFVLSNSILYIGGDFTTVGGQTRNRLAALDSSTGALTSWNPNSGGTVNALALSNSTMYVAGTFTTIGGQTRSNIAAVCVTNDCDGMGTAAGSVTAWNPTGDSFVSAMVLNGSTVYVGGAFTTIGGQTRNRIAALCATANCDGMGTAAGSATTWNPNGDGLVSALALSGSTVYAGGSFTTIGGQTRRRIVALCATANCDGMGTLAGRATVWNPDAASSVSALALNGSMVYAGGTFTTIGGQSRSRIAALCATADCDGMGTAAGSATAWNPDANSNVTALGLSGSTVYVGGSFTSMRAQTRNRIAAIDANTGMVTSWNPSTTGTAVNFLALSGSKVYVGGDFTAIGGQARNRIAALCATANCDGMGTAAGNATTWNPNASAAVSTLALQGSIVYAGGSFMTIGGHARNRIAALCATANCDGMGTAAGNATAWNPNANNGVGSLTVNGSTIYVGGFFTTIGGQARNRIAALCATTNCDGMGTTAGNATTWNPNASANVTSLALSGSTIYAGGTFTTIGGQARNRIAALCLTGNCDGMGTAAGNATAWNPNADSTVNSLAINGSTVYASGFFTTIGGQARNRIVALCLTDNCDGMGTAAGNATAWNPSVGSNIFSLALSGSTAYIGGNFSEVSNIPSRGFTAIPMALP